jgi:hypothetical protein
MLMMQLMILTAKTCKVDEFVLNLPGIHVTVVEVVGMEEAVVVVVVVVVVEVVTEDDLEAAEAGAEETTNVPVVTLRVLVPIID